MRFLIATILFATALMATAQNTNTNCTVYDNQAQCQSTTTPSVQQQMQDQQHEQQDAGRNVGAALGSRWHGHQLKKKVEKFCKDHPGQHWEVNDFRHMHQMSGTCPTS